MDLEELLSQQRKEAKELTGKITALKKSVGKGAGDKKKVRFIQQATVSSYRYIALFFLC